MTLKQKFIAALTARGERQVKETFRYAVFTRAKGGYYYVGRSGGLRYGPTIAASVPCSDAFKTLLCHLTDQAA